VVERQFTAAVFLTICAFVYGEPVPGFGDSKHALVQKIAVSDPGGNLISTPAFAQNGEIRS
jgi:hypothetical protein